MPETELSTPSTPITLLSTSTHTTSAPSTFELRCHDTVSGSSTLFDSSGTQLYSIVAPKVGSSWSVRRSLYDFSGNHLLDLRHQNMDMLLRHWYIEDAGGKKVGQVKKTSVLGVQVANVDMEVFSTQGGSEASQVQMRQKDVGAISTYVSMGGVSVAEIGMVENNATVLRKQLGVDRSAWRIRVAEGVDLGVVIMLASIRAEIAHTTKT